MSAEGLPSFRNPPVVETVLGIQFQPIKGFSNAHLGAFWKTIVESSCADNRWQSASDAFPLAETIERFGEERTWSALNLKLQLSQAPPSVRVQIKNEAADAMIQVQNGRLHFNWIRAKNREYPRYESVRAKFDAVRDEFDRFVKGQGLDAVTLNQWEVTYVNILPRGTVWHEPRDWRSLFDGLPSIGTVPSDLRLESFGGAWHFEIPEQRGRLHVEVKLGETSEDPRTEVIRLTLTARGPVETTEAGRTTLSDGLDLGRQVIVRTFKEITSEAAHAYWELEP